MLEERMLRVVAPCYPVQSSYYKHFKNYTLLYNKTIHSYIYVAYLLLVDTHGWPGGGGGILG